MTHLQITWAFSVERDQNEQFIGVELAHESLRAIMREVGKFFEFHSMSPSTIEEQEDAITLTAFSPCELGREHEVDPLISAISHFIKEKLNVSIVYTTITRTELRKYDRK